MSIPGSLLNKVTDLQPENSLKKEFGINVALVSLLLSLNMFGKLI